MATSGLDRPNPATGQSGKINKLTTTGSLTTYPITNYHVPTSGGGYVNYYITPNYITSRTGDSLVWFSSYNGIGAVTTSGTIATFFVTANGAGTVTNYVFSGITSDASGNLWLLGNYNNVQTLYKFVPSTQSLTPYTISTTPVSNQYNFVGLAIVFTGKYIAFAQPSNDKIWLVDPTTATPSTLSLNISGYHDSQSLVWNRRQSLLGRRSHKRDLNDQCALPAHRLNGFG